jgi:hypothetical protein
MATRKLLASQISDRLILDSPRFLAKHRKPV